MTVNITSEVFGKKPGETYAGAMEAWLLANGYAKKQAGPFTGVGTDNTGATGVAPANDPRNPSNREAPYFPTTTDRNATIANDTTNLTKATFPNPEFDLDDAGVDTEAPSDLVLTPNVLALAGGEVRVTGTNLENITAVAVGGTAGAIVAAETDLDKGILTFTAPAKAAGTYDVVFTDASGNATKTGGLTYEA